MEKIIRIDQIGGFRCFKNYTMENDCPDFAKANIIFGLNGSGKTTFSEFFRAFQQEKTEDLNDFTLIVEGTLLNQINYKDQLRHVKVFNRSYILDTVGRSTRQIEPLYYLGAENKRNAETLQITASEVEQLGQKLEELSNSKTNLQKKHGKTMSDTAREIKNLLSGSNSKYNTYSRTRMDKTMKLLGEEIQTKYLSPNEFQRVMLEARSSVKKPISWSPLDLPDPDKILSYTEKIISTYPLNQAIKRLNDDPDLGEWVFKGLEHHEKHNHRTCQFCGGELKNEMIESLNKHFDKSYKQLYEKLENAIHRIDQLIIKTSNFSLPEFALLYDELVPDYQMEKEKYCRYLKEYAEFLNCIKNFLEKKRKNTIDSDLLAQLNAQFSESTQLPYDDLSINMVISKHNQKHTMFESAVENARQLIEQHKIAEAMPVLLKIQQEITLAEEECKSIENKKNLKLEEVKRIRNDLYNTRMPAELIEGDLRSFFDETNLSIEVQEDGYTITREGIPADYLSESETSIISLIYFIRSLTEEIGGKSDAVIILDDPVVGLDGQRYQKAREYLKRNLIDFTQLFILSHDEVFAKEIEKWFNDEFGEENSRHYILEKGKGIKCRKVEKDYIFGKIF